MYKQVLKYLIDEYSGYWPYTKQQTIVDDLRCYAIKNKSNNVLVDGSLKRRLSDTKNSQRNTRCEEFGDEYELIKLKLVIEEGL